MLKPPISGTGLVGDAPSLAFSVITSEALVGFAGISCPNLLTSVEMSLLRKVIIRVRVRVDGPIKLLKGHESSDKLVVGVQKAAEPLLRLDMIDLKLVNMSWAPCRYQRLT